MRIIPEDRLAEKRGCNELMNRCEYTLKPRALKNARRTYRIACRELYAALARHFRRRQQKR